ncbi:MAG: 4Fe-4S binding protein [Candidatus Freyarchaeum deiterrae]
MRIYPTNDKMIILEEKCIGCGVCSHKCPREAITMIRVREEILEEKISGAMIDSIRKDY